MLCNILKFIPELISLIMMELGKQVLFQKRK